MAGRGDVPSPLPAPYRPHPRVFRLGASHRWVTAVPPLHTDIDTRKTCGIGPAMPFAHHVLASASASSSDDSLVLGLGPCTVGGTRIWMWAKGQPLYEAAVARTRAAVADGGGTVGGVLWFQGESDTIEMDDAQSYGGKMERLVADLRVDIGLPNLLVIQRESDTIEMDDAQFYSGKMERLVANLRADIGLPNLLVIQVMATRGTLCVTALVQYNNWQFASNELLSDVCFKVSGALEEAHCQTDAHLSLMIALSKQNHLALEPYGRSFIKSVLQILAESTKANNSQMIISSIQMIHSITKSLDMSIISSEVTSIIHAMEQYRMIVCHASALQLLSQLRLPTYLASRKSVDKAKK